MLCGSGLIGTHLQSRTTLTCSLFFGKRVSSTESVGSVAQSVMGVPQAVVQRHLGCTMLASTSPIGVSRSHERNHTIIVCVSNGADSGDLRSFSAFEEEEPGFWTRPGGFDLVQSNVPSPIDSDDIDLYVKKVAKKYHERDEFKESSRRLFRTVFEFHNWAEHRATSRYQRHISGMFDSRVVRGIASPLIAVAFLAIVVATGHELINYGVIVIPDALKDVVFINSSLPMSLTSSILGLLLVFRTNSSYSRWLDARKNWGLLVNRSRDVVRQYLTWLCEEEDEQYSGMLCRWVVALAYCLKCHLRENEDAVKKLRELEILHERELEALSKVRNKPLYAMQVLTMTVKALAQKNPNSQPIVMNLELNITQLEDVCGSCERILKTPIPLSYTRHTSRFMIIWLSLLPFALWESCGWGMVPLTAAITLLTLGVEEIGVIIEEPFSVLPLERICATIASDVKEIRSYGSARREPTRRDSMNRDPKWTDPSALASGSTEGPIIPVSHLMPRE